MNDLPSVDIVISIVILISATIGMVRGFVRETVSIVIWVAAFLLAVAFGPTVAALIEVDLRDVVRLAIGWVSVFLAVLIIGAIVQRFLGALVETSGLSGFDRMVGLLFGALRGAVVVIFALVALRPFAENYTWWQTSEIRPVLLEFEEDVFAIFHGTVAGVSQLSEQVRGIDEI